MTARSRGAASARPRWRNPIRLREPHLLGLITVATLSVVAGVAVVGETHDAPLVGLLVVIVVAVAVVLALDVGAVIDAQDEEAEQAPEPAALERPLRPGPDFTGPATRRRVIVVTSHPIAADALLRALGEVDGLGVVVVSPEGFGRAEITNDERHYETARRAEEVTSASLRRAGVLAAGHVGDHDPIQAIEDARALFGAERAVVFAHRDVAGAYRAAVEHAVRTGRIAEPPEIVDVDLGAA
jgi:hypothetical protein